MKKIMFDDKYGLTKAVLEGWKTMTRRIISREKYPLLYSWQQNRLRFEILGNDTLRVWYKAEPKSLRTVDHFDIRIPLQIGDVVAVAQSYLSIHNEMMDNSFGEGYGDAIYDPFRWAIVDDKPGWSNKMFVSADLMPHQIRITNVRVERLQDISDEDCLREGLQSANGGFYSYYNHLTGARLWLSGKTLKKAFAELIDRISGKGTWKSNPWVFVYEFELVK